MAMNDLIQNIDKIHTTALGTERIRKNLQLEIEDVIPWCKVRILNRDAKIERTGEN
jgi:hypothetical protein